jgi:hypothetical protein
MWPRKFGRRSERRAGEGGTNPRPLLDLLIEHQRELFKIEDERIRALEVQAAAVATVALAGLAIVAPAFTDAVDQEPLNVAALVVCGVTVVLAISTFVLSIAARLDYPWRRPRSDEPAEPETSRAARSRQIPSMLVRRANPDEVRPVIRIADARVRALAVSLRERYQGDYAAIASTNDDIPPRLRVIDAWDLRYLSATRRAPVKRKYLQASFVLLVLELMCGISALVLTGQ